MSTYFRQDFFTVPDGTALFFEVRGGGDLPGGTPGSLAARLGGDLPGGTPGSLAARHCPAILCDGLGCDGFVWKYLWPALTPNRQVMHWHYRGHGASKVPQDPTRIGVEFTCDDLARLMDHLSIEAAVLFGHSMGTQVALEFHRRYPKRVKGLVLLCGSYGTPLDTWHDHTLLRVAFPRLLKLVEKFPNAARAITGNLMGTDIALSVAINGELNPELIKRSDFAPYMKHLQQMDPVMFVRTLDSLKDHSALDHLPDVDAPTLVVGGEIDKFTPVWLAHRTAELIPHADYVLVPQGSHTAPLERPGMVNHAVDRFLRERVDAPAYRKTG